ncbi:MAG: N-acetyltransferase [Rhodobacteraceae bacterium]|nr:N-acetyltransferase [Paracoccaceae bacterium]
MSAQVMLNGTAQSSETQAYVDALNARNVEFIFAETGSDPSMPVIEIAGKTLRNPTFDELDIELARAGLYDLGLIHNKLDQAYLRHMAQADALVSYVWQDGQMMLTHIEVDPSLRGTGTGARFGAEVLTALEDAPHEVRLQCPFLRRLGKTRPEWREKFRLES